VIKYYSIINTNLGGKLNMCKSEEFRRSQQVKQHVKSHEIDYSKIPFKERRSTGEKVKKKFILYA